MCFVVESVKNNNKKNIVNIIFKGLMYEYVS